MANPRIATEKDEPTRLTTEREPVGAASPKNGARGSVGDKAVMDAVIMVLAAWAVLFFLVFSLRRYNI